MHDAHMKTLEGLGGRHAGEDEQLGDEVGRREVAEELVGRPGGGIRAFDDEVCELLGIEEGRDGGPEPDSLRDIGERVGLDVAEEEEVRGSVVGG